MFKAFKTFSLRIVDPGETAAGFPPPRLVPPNEPRPVGPRPQIDMGLWFSAWLIIIKMFWDFYAEGGYFWTKFCVSARHGVGLLSLSKIQFRQVWNVV